MKFRQQAKNIRVTGVQKKFSSNGLTCRITSDSDRENGKFPLTDQPSNIFPLCHICHLVAYRGLRVLALKADSGRACLLLLSPHRK